MNSQLSRLAWAAALLVAAGALHAQALSKGDADFMKAAAHSGHTEIEGSKLAVSKASDPQVKSFADKMITDHSKMAEELKALAASKQVELPTEPSLTQKGQLKLLDTLKGDSFDKRYVSSIGVSAHEDTVTLFEKAAAGAQDPQVKSLATKSLPHLQMHLQMARELKAAVDKKQP
jgi:putative membrane protein